MDKKDNRSSEREPEGNSFDYEELVNEPAEDQDYEEYREEDDFDEDEEVVFRFQTMDDPGVCGNDDPGDPDLHSTMEIKQP